MKIIKISILIAFLISASTMISNAQKKKKVRTVRIQTSAQCSMCKTRLENNIAFEKGIKDVELDMETKELIVKFKTRKTNIDKIRHAINELGYDADETTANIVAYEKLPACCKKPEGNEKIIHGK